MKTVNSNRLGNSSQLINAHNQFLQEQLAEAQHSLFFARSVKEMKFLQSRINFLKQRLNEIKRR